MKLILSRCSCWHSSAVRLVKTKKLPHPRRSLPEPPIPTPYCPWEQNHGLFFPEGKYYYTQGAENKIILWETNDITDLEHATRKEVWIPKEVSSSYHLWGPEIHRIDGKWYVYFAADDGNMDNHHIYVIENVSANPLEGEFVMKGRIKTDKDDNWAIHASTFEHRGERYLIWCRMAQTTDRDRNPMHLHSQNGESMDTLVGQGDDFGTGV